MINRLFVISLSFIVLTSSSPKEPLKWLSVQELEERMKTEKRKIIFDIYTDWCGWCKKMDKGTFQNKVIAKYLNENYYAVKVNAEQAQEIVFKQKTYKYVQQGRSGVHEFALYITGNNLRGYPSLSFMDEDLNILTSFAAYMTPENIEPLLHFFAKNKHKVDQNKDGLIDGKDFDHYKNNFKSSF